MRTLLISTILLFLVFHVSAQTSDKNIIVKPVFTEASLEKLHLKKIVVIDSRFDTTKLGYQKSGSRFYALKTASALATSIEQGIVKTFEARFDTAATDVVYLFIKHLWLQQTTLEEESERKLNFGLKSFTTPFSKCTAIFECYLQRDSSFSPLLRFDSSLQRNKPMAKAAHQLLAESFQAAIEKLSTLDLRKKRKVMSWQEVSAFNHRFFRFPIIEKESLHKGVYLSFSD